MAENATERPPDDGHVEEASPADTRNLLDILSEQSFDQNAYRESIKLINESQEQAGRGPRRSTMMVKGFLASAATEKDETRSVTFREICGRDPEKVLWMDKTSFFGSFAVLHLKTLTGLVANKSENSSILFNGNLADGHKCSRSRNCGEMLWCQDGKCAAVVGGVGRVEHEFLRTLDVIRWDSQEYALVQLFSWVKYLYLIEPLKKSQPYRIVSFEKTHAGCLEREEQGMVYDYYKAGDSTIVISTTEKQNVTEIWRQVEDAKDLEEQRNVLAKAFSFELEYGPREVDLLQDAVRRTQSKNEVKPSKILQKEIELKYLSSKDKSQNLLATVGRNFLKKAPGMSRLKKKVGEIEERNNTCVKKRRLLPTQMLRHVDVAVPILH